MTDISQTEMTETTRSFGTQTEQQLSVHEKLASCFISLHIGFHVARVMPFEHRDLYKPSQYLKLSDVFKWIGMQGPSFNSDDYKPFSIKCLQREFNRRLQVHGYFTPQGIEELSRDYKICSGKWLFYVHSCDVDEMWSLVIDTIAKNEFDGFSSYAKVSTRPILTQQVICIYTKSKHVNEIINLENVIRKLGVKGRLYFKPDIYTFCGIHYKHKCLIRPVTFVSDFRNGGDKSSVIRTQFHVRK